MDEPKAFSEICPRCEEGLLTTVLAPQDIPIEGTLVRIDRVQMEECPLCGFQSLSGRDAGLYEILFAPEYERIADLVQALKKAGYYGMFLREDQSESFLGFGAREYVAALEEGVKGLYLDNESHHVLQGLARAGSGLVPVDLAGRKFTIKLPKIGEGENGVVYDYQESAEGVLKIAKPRAYSRRHLQEEFEVTDFFEKQGVPVPRILLSDSFGSFMIKQRLAGTSLARLYHQLGGPTHPLHQRVKEEVRRFISHLLELFVKYPEAKTSVSPNNIFILLSESECRCLLVDTGPAPFHDYSHFQFDHYWETVIPQKIRQYAAAGYL